MSNRVEHTTVSRDIKAGGFKSINLGILVGPRRQREISLFAGGELRDAICQTRMHSYLFGFFLRAR